MDIAAQSVNFVNVLAALGVSMSWVSDYVANIGLFVFNLGAIGFFLLNLLAAPIRFCLAQRELVERVARLAADKAADAAGSAVDAAGAAAGAAGYAAGSAVKVAGSAVGSAASAAGSAINRAGLPAPVAAAGRELVGVIGSGAQAVSQVSPTAVAAGARSVVDASMAVGGAAIGAAAHGANAVAVAAPSLLRSTSSLAQQGIQLGVAGLSVAQESAKHGLSAAGNFLQSDSTQSAVRSAMDSASGAVSSAVSSASNFVSTNQHITAARAAAAAYVFENTSTVAEMGFEKTVASHGDSNLELAAKFDDKPLGAASAAASS
jgi:hypothetical protein